MHLCTCHAFSKSHQLPNLPEPQGPAGSMDIPPPEQETLAQQIPAAVGTGEGGYASSQELQPGETLGKGLSKTNLKM